jgi:hypothetical protein
MMMKDKSNLLKFSNFVQTIVKRNDILNKQIKKKDEDF